MVMRECEIVLIVLLTFLFILPGCVHEPNNQDKNLTDDDIELELKILEKINTHPQNQNIDRKKYPRILGTHSKNGLTLLEIYYCSDICPDYGAVLIVYEEINSVEECEEINGKILFATIGGYIGCSPNLE